MVKFGISTSVTPYHRQASGAGVSTAQLWEPGLPFIKVGCVCVHIILDIPTLLSHLIGMHSLICAAF